VAVARQARKCLQRKQAAVSNLKQDKRADGWNDNKISVDGRRLFGFWWPKSILLETDYNNIITINLNKDSSHGKEQQRHSRNPCK
jgi:hypothetical protein